uniref:Uncharacterized protein n=1 Tax=Cucumis melo TaxID=3656 RepID=A0A9I9E379_CUCME
MTNLRCVGYTQYNNVYKLYDVVGPVQHSHRLCRNGARPALTTASLLRSTVTTQLFRTKLRLLPNTKTRPFNIKFKTDQIRFIKTL